MRQYLVASALLVVSSPFPAISQTAAGRGAVAGLPAAFSEAWATHRGDELAKLVSADIDFVNVGAIWLHG
jgi:hypothetical protein